eukprot:3616336-Amphidinium_carterae.1
MLRNRGGAGGICKSQLCGYRSPMELLGCHSKQSVASKTISIPNIYSCTLFQILTEVDSQTLSQQFKCKSRQHKHNALLCQRARHSQQIQTSLPCYLSFCCVARARHHTSLVAARTFVYRIVPSVNSMHADIV